MIDFCNSLMMLGVLVAIVEFCAVGILWLVSGTQYCLRPLIVLPAISGIAVITVFGYLIDHIFISLLSLLPLPLTTFLVIHVFIPDRFKRKRILDRQDLAIGIALGAVAYIGVLLIFYLFSP